MMKEIYRNILNDIILLHAKENMPINQIWQQNNDLKHTSKLVKNDDNHSSLIIWPAQLLDLHLIENFQNEIRKAIPKEKNHKYDSTMAGSSSLVQDINENM